MQGWLSIFVLDEEGKFRDEDGIRYETPTSGGKANAISLLPKKDGPGIWILLTDDDEVGAVVPRREAVRVLEWDGMETGGLSVVAEWPGDGSDEEKICGASHAIWLDWLLPYKVSWALSMGAKRNFGEAHLMWRP